MTDWLISAPLAQYINEGNSAEFTGAGASEVTAKVQMDTPWMN